MQEVLRRRLVDRGGRLLARLHRSGLHRDVVLTWRLHGNGTAREGGVRAERGSGRFRSSARDLPRHRSVRSRRAREREERDSQDDDQEQYGGPGLPHDREASLPDPVLAWPRHHVRTGGVTPGGQFSFPIASLEWNRQPSPSLLHTSRVTHRSQILRGAPSGSRSSHSSFSAITAVQVAPVRFRVRISTSKRVRRTLPVWVTWSRNSVRELVFPSSKRRKSGPSNASSVGRSTSTRARPQIAYISASSARTLAEPGSRPDWAGAPVTATRRTIPRRGKVRCMGAPSFSGRHSPGASSVGLAPRNDLVVAVTIGWARDRPFTACASARPPRRGRASPLACAVGPGGSPRAWGRRAGTRPGSRAARVLRLRGRGR